MPPDTGILGVDAGPLAERVSEWAGRVLAPYLAKHETNPHRDSKLIHDPIGKAIMLQPWEIYIVDSPLLQRLRSIRQLGVGHFLFPTAGYSRFEHSIGCVKAASTLFDAIFDEASHPQIRYERERLVARRDVVRLAALLHDTGHCILSHVSEKFYEQDTEVAIARERLRRYYGNPVAAAEAVAILILRSTAFRLLLNKSGMRRAEFSEREVIDKICACIAGSKNRLAPDSYMAEIVNGPVDCDKIDYLARDAHMAGVPISLDIERLLSKLRVVKAPDADVYSLAIVPSGARALEEMLVSRIFLYDKFYYHPKIMAAEELIRRALYYIANACPTLRSPAALLDYGDDEFLSLTAPYIANRYGIDSGDQDLIKGCALLACARARDLPLRAFSFARRFIPEMPAIYGRFVNEGREETVPQSILDFISTDSLLREHGGTDRAARQLREIAEELHVDTELFVGYQSARRAAGKMDMPVLLPGDVVEPTPDFLFNVSKWSDAYALNKQTSYVFAYTDLPKVHLIAERFFRERLLTFAPKSWVWTKISEAEIDTERAALPKNDQWLPHRLPPNYLSLPIAERRIEALEDKFASYLRGFDEELGPQLVTGWVWQFEDSDLQESALCLLEHINFIEKRHIVDGFSLTVTKHPELTKALWVPFRSKEGQGKSADQVKYDVKELGLRMKDAAMLSAEDVTAAPRVVFFDDLLNSGVQADCLIGSWFGEVSCESPEDRDPVPLSDEVQAALKNARVDFVYYSSNPDGEARLRTACERVGLQLEQIHRNINTGDKRYTLAGLQCSNPASRDRFIRFLRARGEAVLREKHRGKEKWTDERIRRFALGYGDIQLTLIYRHSVSTAVPPALWEMSTDTMQPWLPLFPRDANALIGVLDPKRAWRYAREIEDASLPDFRESREDFPLV